ncbi:hypothetical protein ABZ897_24700 [Nonomuraea sp. NPDC046802]|uniref:hypothetical protein n=1 Tax=Nonomuraea sp. NPDC046802 TaxID=3154919 RepID=UPI0033D8929F
MSLSSVNIAGGNDHFVGFDNYAEAFTDPRMWRSLWNTLVFTVLSTIPLVLLGLLFALLVHHLRFVQWLCGCRSSGRSCCRRPSCRSSGCR